MGDVGQGFMGGAVGLLAPYILRKLLGKDAGGTPADTASGAPPPSVGVSSGGGGLLSKIIGQGSTINPSTANYGAQHWLNQGTSPGSGLAGLVK